MTEEHLNIDTDFLDDKKQALKVDTQSSTPTPNKRYNWGKILLVIGGVLFFFWLIGSAGTSSSPSTTSTPTRTNTSVPTNTSTTGGSVVVGEYMCSDYHARKSEELEPTESEYAITAAQNQIAAKERQLSLLESRIDNSTVTEYSSQWQIDQYNEMIDEYNTLFTSYSLESDRVDRRIDKYNAEVDAYNSYLIRNCKPIR